MSTKQCTKCKRIKGTEHFCKHKRSADGLESWCRSCHANRYFTYQSTYGPLGLFSYQNAWHRCNSSKHRSYKYYGGRGIRFLLPSFKSLLRRIGPRPGGLTLDRINNNGHYKLGNVQWLSMKEQNKKKSKACMSTASESATNPPRGDQASG